MKQQHPVLAMQAPLVKLGTEAEQTKLKAAESRSVEDLQKELQQLRTQLEQETALEGKQRQVRRLIITQGRPAV